MVAWERRRGQQNEGGWELDGRWTTVGRSRPFKKIILRFSTHTSPLLLFSKRGQKKRQNVKVFPIRGNDHVFRPPSFRLPSSTAVAVPTEVALVDACSLVNHCISNSKKWRQSQVIHWT